MKPEIVLTVPIYAPVLAQLDREYTVHKLWQAGDPEAFLKKISGTVRAAVTTGSVPFGAAYIDLLPKLELIACFGNPRGTIDRAATSRRGIAVSYTPDYISPTVAELAVGMMLALMRRICEGDRFVRAGHWPNGAAKAGATLARKTCGIVGMGKIGREVAKRVQVFGMSVCYYGPRPKKDISYRYFDDLASLAQAADCLIVSCPLTSETRNMVDARVLNALGSGGFLVNVARGAVVNEQALVTALEENRIAGAALDVFWDEPRVPTRLLAMENVVLLPHIGSMTSEVRDERGRKLLANLRAHFAGEPLPNPSLRSDERA